MVPRFSKASRQMFGAQTLGRGRRASTQSALFVRRASNDVAACSAATPLNVAKVVLSIFEPFISMACA
jgi:hypothetical protein